MPRKFSTLALTSSAKPPETNHRRGGRRAWRREGGLALPWPPSPGLQAWAVGKVAQEGRQPTQPTCANPKETLLLPTEHANACLFY